MTVGLVMKKPTTTMGVEEIIPENDPVHKVVFPSLEELRLKRLYKIEKLWADQLQGVSYCQNLTKGIVGHCDRLKYMFSYSMVNRLLQLQYLEISDCESMEGVVDTTGLRRGAFPWTFQTGHRAPLKTILNLS
ncbi:hypothetical protein AB3S75_012742 [Citrus x aurantiifolia]